MSIPLVKYPDGALQPNVPFNENMKWLGALVNASAEATTNTPPTTALSDVGKIWIVGTAPVALSAFDGKANQIALCTAAGLWEFQAPTVAWLVWDKLANQMKRWDGSAWVVFTATSGSTNKGHISGLQITWNSATSVSVGTGEAYIEGNVAVVQVNSAITKSSLSLSASTWYHLYLYLNSGVPDVEVSTAAPAAAYSGLARSKTSDTSRRYLGSMKTNASSQVIKFFHNVQAGKIDYLTHVNVAPLLVLNAGTASTSTTVSCSGIVPITSRTVLVFMDNSDTGVRVGLGNSDLGATTNTNFFAFLFANSAMTSMLALDGSQALTYLFFSAPAVGNFSIRVTGYLFER